MGRNDDDRTHDGIELHQVEARGIELCDWFDDGVDPVVATDGIEEFLDVYVRTRGKQTLTAPLVLATTKPAQAWTLSPAERVGRVNVVSGRTPNVTTELKGRPEPLLLVLWGRIDLADAPLETIGDATIAASLTAQP